MTLDDFISVALTVGLLLIVIIGSAYIDGVLGDIGIALINLI